LVPDLKLGEVLRRESTWLEARMNKNPTAQHPLDVLYDSVVDEPQLSQYLVSPW
jgi:hypothetical protein